MSQFSEVFYQQTNYLPVGKPVWVSEPNDSAKAIHIALAASAFCLINYSFFSHLGDTLLLPSISEWVLKFSRFLIFLTVPPAFLICLLRGKPATGRNQHNVYKCSLRLDEHGIKILLTDDMDSDLYDYSWSCLWKNVSILDIRKEEGSAPECYLTISGNSTSHALDHLDGLHEPLSESQQIRIFGGVNTITIGLADDAEAILEALDLIHERSFSE